MLPRKIRSWAGILLGIVLLYPISLVGQPEPQGMLIYQQPATTYTEAYEFRSFRQENALYATVIDVAGQRKQLKAGGVLAVLPYPPLSLEPDFENTARPALAKIESLKQTYPAVRAQLEKARGKWARALNVFEQGAPAAAATPTGALLSVLSLKRGVLQNVRLTSATPESVTVYHASGVATVPIAELTPAQIVDLNRHSKSVQIPLGISRAPASPRLEHGSLTARVEASGRKVLHFCAAKIGINPVVLSVWTFFVALPAAVVLLLLSMLLSARRSRVGIKPAPGVRMN